MSQFQCGKPALFFAAKRHVFFRRLDAGEKTKGETTQRVRSAPAASTEHQKKSTKKKTQKRRPKKDGGKIVPFRLHPLFLRVCARGCCRLDTDNKPYPSACRPCCILAAVPLLCVSTRGCCRLDTDNKPYPSACRPCCILAAAALGSMILCFTTYFHGIAHERQLHQSLLWMQDVGVLLCRCLVRVFVLCLA